MSEDGVSGDDFALWTLEILQRSEVLGSHTDPYPSGDEA